MTTSPQPTQPLSDERVAFEAAMRNSGWRDFSKVWAGCADAALQELAYQQDGLQQRWRGWQARAALLSPPIQQTDERAALGHSLTDKWTPGTCLPHGVLFDAFGRPRIRYVRVSHDGTTCVVPPQDVESLVDAERPDDYRTEDVYLSTEEFNALPEFDGF